jgi:hypothetical protein
VFVGLASKKRTGRKDTGHHIVFGLDVGARGEEIVHEIA